MTGTTQKSLNGCAKESAVHFPRRCARIRTAQGALAENEACSRTVLSRGYSAELETTGSLP